MYQVWRKSALVRSFTAVELGRRSSPMRPCRLDDEHLLPDPGGAFDGGGPWSQFNVNFSMDGESMSVSEGKPAKIAA